jgi:hypothetical protein
VCCGRSKHQTVCHTTNDVARLPSPQLLNLNGRSRAEKSLTFQNYRLDPPRLYTNPPISPSLATARVTSSPRVLPTCNGSGYTTRAYAPQNRLASLRVATPRRPSPNILSRFGQCQPNLGSWQKAWLSLSYPVVAGMMACTRNKRAGRARLKRDKCACGLVNAKCADAGRRIRCGNVPCCPGWVEIVK